MAAGDRTGPMGQGSRTGRALGFCSGYDNPGFTKRYSGGDSRGFGNGRGRGRGICMGRGRGFEWPFAGFFQSNPKMSSASKNDEVTMLKSQAETLKRSQENIEKRLRDLEKEGE